MTNPNKPPEGPFVLIKRRDTERPYKSELYPSNREPFNIRSYFDPKEELLLLACLYSGFRPHVPPIKPLSLSSNLFKRSGNALESLVCQSIINSSHQSSFRGIGIEKFYQKLFGISIRQMKR